MLMIDVMTKDVITVKKDTPVAEAHKLMMDHNIRRLPVVDDKGKPIGIVTEKRLQDIKPSTGSPLLWQISYIFSRTTVGDVMRKKVVTVKPADTVEYAIAKAQSAKVGTLVVVDGGKIVGIASTNDFFYKIVNPTLGIGESGSRVVIVGGGTGKNAEQIISLINKMGLGLKLLWSIYSPSIKKYNLVVHLDTEDSSQLIEALTKLDYDARPVNR